MTVGTHWLVDAHGCPPGALRDLEGVRALLEGVIARLELRVLGDPRGLWHKFGGEAGVTGVYLLTESHLSIHTYPEHGLATLDLYCCRPAARAAFPWEAELTRALGAGTVTIRMIERGASA